ncbi:MAG: hypothetical protein C0392_03905 [Syntrophus sp. (in: bacteria)]|nr:hypothetical protein [Syntrophus sp. (in: bacteria)]
MLKSKFLSVSSNSSLQIARFLGWTILAFIMYSAISAVVFLVSQVLLQKGITPNLPWIAAVQEHLYFSGARNIWQAQPGCVVFDQDLIYKPKDGACQFDNVEFKTVQRFSPEGRYTGPKPDGMGIAVLGDSHAVGWGVGDEETFAAELQRLSGRPVYNLAVSSYGTVRELMRLEKSGLLDKIDTIVIQYCDNDLEENMEFRPASPQANQQKFSTIIHARQASLSSKLKHLSKGYRFTFRTPYSSLKKKLFTRAPDDFSRHYQPFIAALGKHDVLKTKRIIVFYSNAHGDKLRSFPVGKDRQLPNVVFVDLDLERNDYYRIDGHPTRAGHKKAARRLMDIL